MVAPLSLRLPDLLREKVRRLAAMEHRSFSEMTRLLVDDAVRMREFPDIEFTEGPTGRRATMRAGLDVWEIVEPYLVAGKDWDSLRNSYPDLDEGPLRSALRYYEAYPEEIEARIALNQET
jgi:uncharacterized protein (DUF433 family)